MITDDVYEHTFEKGLHEPTREKKRKNIEPKQLARLSLLVVVPLMRFYIHSSSSSLRINHIEDECNRVDQTKLARELI